MKLLLLFTTHIFALAIGFALGIYFLPILTAPKGPDQALLEAQASNAIYSAEFIRDLKGSDLFHWGEGSINLSSTQIVHMGRLAPGPDYKLYLAPEFTEDEDSFLAIKDQSVQIGDVKTFEGIILEVPEGIDIEAYNTVLIWCEAFGEFITAAQYR